MTVALPILGAVAAWLGLLWITSRPGAAYVGTLPPEVIAIRCLAAALRRMQRQIGEALREALPPVLECAAARVKALNEAIERAERTAGLRE